jgi:hypothetical protein
MVGRCTSLFQPCLPLSFAPEAQRLGLGLAPTVPFGLDLKHKKYNDDSVPVMNPFLSVWDGVPRLNRDHIFD